MTAKIRKAEIAKAGVIRHPDKKGKFILIARRQNGRRVAFEVDQPGK